MIEKPITAKLVELLQELVSTLKNDKQEDESVTVETPTTEDDSNDSSGSNTEEDEGPIEPEINGGVAGF